MHLLQISKWDFLHLFVPVFTSFITRSATGKQIWIRVCLHLECLILAIFHHACPLLCSHMRDAHVTAHMQTCHHAYHWYCSLKICYHGEVLARYIIDYGTALIWQCCLMCVEHDESVWLTVSATCYKCKEGRKVMEAAFIITFFPFIFSPVAFKLPHCFLLHAERH